MNRTIDAWEENARADPLFAILTDNTRRASWDIDDFFASGETEISRVFTFMDNAHISVNCAGRFLDFGCGVGRNTRALMKRFKRGIGIDVSPTMISWARRYAENDPGRADYVVSQSSDLSVIPDSSIDFLYSHIVLQHVPNRMQRRYIAEFMRVLSPRGVAAFQIPTGWISQNPTVILKTLTPHWLKYIYNATRGRDIKIEMHILSHAIVEKICLNGGGSDISSCYSNSTERDCNGNIEFLNQREATDRIRCNAVDSQYLSEFFFVRKPA